MNILIAIDSFKGTLDSSEAAEAVKRGLTDCSCTVVPVSDGGEGMMQAVFSAVGGQLVKTKVKNPVNEYINAEYLFLGDTAVMEMSRASGLILVEEKKRNAMLSSTFGTGEMMASAIERGAKHIIIGIGGSATTDCGTGMAEALGACFFSSSGESLDGNGYNLSRIQSFDLSKLKEKLNGVDITVCSDVNNPLFGKNGAAHVYAPQKGAGPAEVTLLDNGLCHLGTLIDSVLKVGVSELPGAGAAGGLGAGLVAFCGAKLRKGFETLAEITHLEEKIANCDVVVTGEGRTDSQTLNGKLPAGVASLCKKHQKPCYLLSGCFTGNSDDLDKMGITELLPCYRTPPVTLPSKTEASNKLVEAAKRLKLLLDVKAT